MRCRDHPYYQGKRRPTSECKVCHQIYEDTMKGKHDDRETDATNRP